MSVSVTVYRLVKERFLSTPLSVEGARLHNGRWHPAGRGIIYTSSSPELALLEQLVHLPTLPFEDLPKLFLLTLSIPSNTRILTPDELPSGWRYGVYFFDNQEFMTAWLLSPNVLSLGVPSAVVAESINYLLHPMHPLFAEVKVVKINPFPLDPHLVRTP